MSFCPEYVRIYDILHGQKDYHFETDLLRELVKSRGAEADVTLVDYGCGTGNHARLLASWCKNVIGVDPNEHMLAAAKEKSEAVSNVLFYNTREQDKIPAQSVQICVALFDVLSYMNRDEEVDAFLSFVKRVSAPNALFVFDFWYQPAILHLRPIDREKQFQTDHENVIKKIRPVLEEEKNRVKISHEITILDQQGTQTQQFADIHFMRYFSEEEIRKFLQRHGFSILNFGTWKDLNTAPTREDWSALMVTQLQTQS